MTIHENEVPTGVGTAERLLADQRPDLVGLNVRPVGDGTENTMYRLGDDLLLRLPRTEAAAAALAKELRWLPRLAPLLACEIPSPVFAGAASPDYPLSWAIYRWIEGEPASRALGVDWATVDWATYGRDLAGFVTDLRAVDLTAAYPDDAPGARPAGELTGYRGGLLAPHDAWVRSSLAQLRELGSDAQIDVDVDVLERQWREALTLPEPTAAPVWLHSDLKPSNVIVRSGRLCAVIDFGGLIVGLPDAEHAPTWDLPAEARDAYRAALDLDDATWLRARAWALMVGVSGVPYYWHTYPEFVAECLHRLRAVAGDCR